MVMTVEQLVEYVMGTGETEVLRENLPQCHCPLQTLHDLTWDRTRYTVVRSWKLTAWAMVQPCVLLCIISARTDFPYKKADTCNTLCKDIAHTFLYTTGVNYILLEIKSVAFQ
jgi:hypothetical protein